MSTTNRGVAGASPSGMFDRRACKHCGRVVAHSYVTGRPHGAHKPPGSPCWGTPEAKAFWTAFRARNAADLGVE